MSYWKMQESRSYQSPPFITYYVGGLKGWIYWPKAWFDDQKKFKRPVITKIGIEGQENSNNYNIQICAFEIHLS